jgi:hypothetical protein
MLRETVNSDRLPFRPVRAANHMNDRLITATSSWPPVPISITRRWGYRSVAAPTSWARVCTLLFGRKVLQIILNGAFGDTRAMKIDCGAS